MWPRPAKGFLRAAARKKRAAAAHTLLCCLLYTSIGGHSAHRVHAPAEQRGHLAVHRVDLGAGFQQLVQKTTSRFIKNDGLPGK